MTKHSEPTTRVLKAVDFLMQLYESDKPLGIVNRETFEFSLSDYRFPYVQKPQTLQRV